MKAIVITAIMTAKTVVFGPLYLINKLYSAKNKTNSPKAEPRQGLLFINFFSQIKNKVAKIATIKENNISTNPKPDPVLAFKRKKNTIAVTKYKTNDKTE